MGLDRNAVIDAAQKIADAEGLAAVSLARLAADLRVKPPSLYNHADGLEDVLRALALRGGRIASRRVTRAAVGLARSDAVVALGLAYLDFAREHPGLYAAALRVPAVNDEESQAVVSEILDTVMAVLGGFGLHGDDASHAARGLRAIIHGFVALEAGGGFGLPLDVEESLRRLLVAFCAGLLRAGPSST